MVSVPWHRPGPRRSAQDSRGLPAATLLAWGQTPRWSRLIPLLLMAPYQRGEAAAAGAPHNPVLPVRGWFCLLRMGTSPRTEAEGFTRGDSLWLPEVNGEPRSLGSGLTGLSCPRREGGHGLVVSEGGWFALTETPGGFGVVRSPELHRKLCVRLMEVPHTGKNHAASFRP